MDKKAARSRRSRKTRVRIAEQRATRLVVSRSNCHIYAQIIAPERRGLRHGLAALVVDDLRVDLLVAAEHGQTRALGGAFHFLADAHLTPCTSFDFCPRHVAILALLSD
jgi:hypothetical protein